MKAFANSFHPAINNSQEIKIDNIDLLCRYHSASETKITITMHTSTALSLSFTLLRFFAIIKTSGAQESTSCTADADCPSGTNSVCVIPLSPDSDEQAGNGTCYPSCTLTSNERPCSLGQACQSLPQISIMQIGYCPKPAKCGGFIGALCEDDRNPSCVDDPRDDCDPNNGGADCEGICVAKESQKARRR